MSVITAIDPGPKPGVTTYLEEQNVFVFGIIPGFAEEQITQEGMLALEAKIKASDIIIYENYRLRPDLAGVQTGSEMFTVKVIGLIQMYEVMYPEKKFIKQEPSRQMGDALLKAIGLWDAPCFALDIDSKDLSHVRSSLAHLATYVEKNDEELFQTWVERSFQNPIPSCREIRKSKTPIRLIPRKGGNSAGGAGSPA